MAAGSNALPILAMARQVTTQLQEFSRTRIEPIFRGYKLFPKLKANGRISGGHGGDFFEFRPRKRRRTIAGGAGNVLTVSFPNTNVHDICTLPYREYKLGESVTQMEDLASKPAATRFFQKAIPVVTECMDDFMKDLPTKFYVDGGANSTDVHGIDSFTGNTGAVISNSVLADPSDTYATKSTALGSGSGTWTGNYPQGTGDTEYNWFSPWLVDYNSTLLGGTTYNWENNWERALNYAMTYMFKLQSLEPNTLIVDAEMLRKAKDSKIGAQTLEIMRTAQDKDPAVARIFYNGVELLMEYGCPSDVGYLFDVKTVTLKHLGSDLVHVKEAFDIDAGVYKYLFRFFGNWDFQTPAWYCKLLAIAAGS